MILLLNHLRSVRYRILIGLPLLLAAILFCYRAAYSNPATKTVAFEHLLDGIQDGLFAGLIYTPIFISLISPLLNYVRSPQLIQRIGGVSRSFRKALGISLFMTILYSTFLFALTLATPLLPGIKTPETKSFVLVCSLFAEYFAYILHFFSCSILMLMVYALSGRRANVSITFVLGYGLFDYLGGAFGIIGISATEHVSTLPIGWTFIHNVTTNLFSREITSGFAAAVGTIIQILCFCIVGCLILHHISDNFDCLSEREVDSRA